MDSQPEINILFEDDHLLAVDKPAGIITIRDGYHPQRPNLHEILSKRFGRLWVVHRLDAETSGVLLFARTPAAHRHLSQQFEHHTIQKTYRLLSYGQTTFEKREILLPLRVNGDRRHRTIIDTLDGKQAKTVFAVSDTFSNEFSLLIALPSTGYTHQIRAHCASLGLWLINDPLYLPHPFPKPLDFIEKRLPALKNLVEDLPIKRVALHAESIKFFRPDTEDRLELIAPMPADFIGSIQYLARKKSEVRIQP